MLRTGKEHLESLRDGRVVYIGGERVDDVTAPSGVPRRRRRRWPAIYDMKADPANRDAMTYEEDGGRHSIYFLRAEDPRRSAAAHGRPPPHRRSHLRHVRPLARSRRVVRHRHGDEARRAARAARLRRQPAELLPAHPRQRHLRRLRGGAAAGRAQSGVLPARRTSRCRRCAWCARTTTASSISGMKMLATGALFANEIWIGNVIPLAPDQKKEAITCAIPCNAPGLTLWSRKPLRWACTSEFDSPLAWRYDESDSMLMCDERQGAVGEGVRARRRAAVARHLHQDAEPLLRQPPVERALLVEDAAAARPVQPDRATPPAPTRCRRCARRSARWRRSRRRIGGMVNGQINAFENWPEGYVCFNRRFMYAGARLVHAELQPFIDELRELCGGGVFQMPADISVMDDPELAQQFETYWQTPQADARHAHEAVQARLGHGRLGVRRPPPAIREVLRRRLVHRPQPLLSARPTGPSSTRWSTT